MSYEKYIISIEGVGSAKEIYSLAHKEILEQIEDFKLMFGKDPKFVKLPMGVYSILKHYYKSLVFSLSKSNDNEIEKFCGLIICPTHKITHIFEIEVF